MMSTFLAIHRGELIRRCANKAAMRPLPNAAPSHDDSCIPIFIGQLQRTLEAEEEHQPSESLRISGAPGGDAQVVSEMAASATRHGRELLELGFSVDQVVHGYGDLCQAVTDLAFELDAPFAVSEFRTLNRCLDNGIASAVAAFSAHRDASVAAQASERVDTLLHGLRSSLATVTYAVAALELGNLPLSGSTGSILKRGLADMQAKLGGPTLAELQE